MTKTFCDRCKKEIAKTSPLFPISIAGQVEADLCEECFNDLGHFMDGAPLMGNHIDDIVHKTSKELYGHGIERTTFGSK